MSVERPTLPARDQIEEAILILQNLKIPATLDDKTEEDFRKILTILSDLQLSLFSIFNKELGRDSYYRLDELLKNLNSSNSLPYSMVKIRTVLQFKNYPINDERSAAIIAATIQQASTGIIEIVNRLKEIAAFVK